MESSGGCNNPMEATQELFGLVDRNGDGHLDLKEVAALFKQLAPDQSTRSAYNAAVEALLLTDSNIDRKLDRGEFQELLDRLAGVAGVSTATAAQSLLTAATQGAAANSHDATAAATEAPGGGQQGPDLPAAAAATTASTPAADPTAQLDHAKHGGEKQKQKQQQQQAPTGDKLQQLFGLWDRTGDGSISFYELCQGLAKLMRVKGKEDITSLLNEAARFLTTHDKNHDGMLQFDEFTAFITKFMAAAGFRLEEVLDELMLLAHKRDSRKIQAVVEGAQPQIDSILSEAGR